MAYEVRSVSARHALADKPIELPIMVLLAMPATGKGDTAGIFNLPHAVNRLLGNPGWIQARTIIDPRILALGWRQADLTAFVRDAEELKGRAALSDADIEEISLTPTTGGLADALGQVPGGFDVRHFARGRAAEREAHASEWRPGERSFFARVTGAPSFPPALVSGPFMLSAFDERTRLLIVQAALHEAKVFAEFAERVVGAGGPAVLVVASDDHTRTNEYLTDVYANIIHNVPLSEAAKPHRKLNAQIELWLGDGGDSLLSFDRMVDDLFARAEQLKHQHEQFTMQMEQRLAHPVVPRHYEAFLHRSSLGALESRLRVSMAGTAARGRTLGKAIGELDRPINFARESKGVYPLSQLSRSLRSLETDVGTFYSAVDEQLEADLREAALHAPRVLNANFFDPRKKEVVASRETLMAGEQYDLLVDIGPRWNAIQSIVSGHGGFPEKALAGSAEGFPVLATLVSDDFVPPIVSRWLWVPRDTGRSIPYDSANEAGAWGTPSGRPKRSKPGPAMLGFAVRKLLSDESLHGIAVSARLSLYYESNLLQSARVRVNLSASGGAVREGENEIKVDFTLTNTFQAVESRYRRRLLSFRSKEKPANQSVKVNFTLNDDELGGNRIIVAGRPESGLPPPGFAPYNPAAMTAVLSAARSELLNIFFRRDEQGAVIEASNGLNDKNGKEYDQFRFDLRELCKIGSNLFNVATDQIRVDGGKLAPVAWRRQLRKALAKSSVIQVSRAVRAEYAFPWALVYDIPMPGPRFHFCKVVEEWRQGARSGAEMLECCPYADQADHQENVYCPYALWGLKHVIEQPPSENPNRNGEWQGSDAEDTFARKPDIDLAVAVTRDPNLNTSRINDHLAALKNIPRLRVTPPGPADDVVAARGIMVAPDLVYLLCHGDVDRTGPLPLPYLGIGLRDSQPEHMIYQRTVEGWADADVPPNLSAWLKLRPLVFINGCHTADLTPEGMLNIVTAFSYARAIGVVGTEVSVRLEVATDVAERVLRKIASGAATGTALREMRWELANKGNLIGLAYTLHGLASVHASTA